jgi:transcriptional regulator with GAF, ATPase, and Fis domain
MMTTGTKTFFDVVEEYERKLIGEALTQANGNQARAARILGLKPTTLNSQIQRLNIDVSSYRRGGHNLSYDAFAKLLLWKSERP